MPSDQLNRQPLLVSNITSLRSHTFYLSFSASPMRDYVINGAHRMPKMHVRKWKENHLKCQLMFIFNRKIIWRIKPWRLRPSRSSLNTYNGSYFCKMIFWKICYQLLPNFIFSPAASLVYKERLNIKGAMRWCQYLLLVHTCIIPMTMYCHRI